MVNVIAVLALAAVLGAAIVYVVKSKKRGHKCVGCSYAKECAARAAGCGCSAAKSE